MPYSYTLTLPQLLQLSTDRYRPIKALCPLCPKPNPMAVWTGSPVDEGGMWWHWYCDHYIVDVERDLWQDSQRHYKHFDCVVCGLPMREFFKTQPSGFISLDWETRRPAYLLMLHMLLLDRQSQQEHIAAMLLMGAEMRGCK